MFPGSFETVKGTVSHSEHCVFNSFVLCLMMLSSVYICAVLQSSFDNTWSF